METQVPYRIYSRAMEYVKLPTRTDYRMLEYQTEGQYSTKHSTNN